MQQVLHHQIKAFGWSSVLLKVIWVPQNRGTAFWAVISSPEENYRMDETGPELEEELQNLAPDHTNWKDALIVDGLRKKLCCSKIVRVTSICASWASWRFFCLIACKAYASLANWDGFNAHKATGLVANNSNGFQAAALHLRPFWRFSPRPRTFPRPVERRIRGSSKRGEKSLLPSAVTMMSIAEPPPKSIRQHAQALCLGTQSGR